VAVTIGYVLPILWMTLPIIGQAEVTPRGRILKETDHVRTWDEV